MEFLLWREPAETVDRGHRIGRPAGKEKPKAGLNHPSFPTEGALKWLLPDTPDPLIQGGNSPGSLMPFRETVALPSEKARDLAQARRWGCVANSATSSTHLNGMTSLRNAPRAA